MADSTPIMSGANEAAATATQETEQVTQSPSLPSAPAADTSATEEATEEKTTTEAGAAAGPTTTERAAAAAAPLAAGSTSDGPAPTTTGGVLEMPQPPQPALIRDGPAVDNGLVCNITLLLPNGNRHPFRIDEKYLTKRGVEVPDLTENGRKDPFSVSVYKLKELILREWREEWESKPASPSSIRLIHFGKLLDDKEQLRKYHFSPESPNVVHMSVKPADVIEDEEAAKGKSSGRESRSREGSNGCCVIL